MSVIMIFLRHSLFFITLPLINGSNQKWKLDFQIHRDVMFVFAFVFDTLKINNFCQSYNRVLVPFHPLFYRFRFKCVQFERSFLCNSYLTWQSLISPTITLIDHKDNVLFFNKLYFLLSISENFRLLFVGAFIGILDFFFTFFLLNEIWEASERNQVILFFLNDEEFL